MEDMGRVLIGLKFPSKSELFNQSMGFSRKGGLPGGKSSKGSGQMVSRITFLIDFEKTDIGHTRAVGQTFTMKRMRNRDKTAGHTEVLRQVRG